MSFLQSRFSFLLVCSIQLIPQTLLQGAGIDAATVDAFTTQTSCLAAPAFSDESNKSFAFKSPSLTSLEKKGPLSPTDNYGIGSHTISWMCEPFDCLKKASLAFLKAPLLFLATTNAFMPVTYANSPKHPTLLDRFHSGTPPQKQEHSYIPFGLSLDWNTTACEGRALSSHEIGRSQTLKNRCRTVSCMPRIAYSAMCNNPTQRYVLGAICDDITCAPYSIGLGLTNSAQHTIKSCTHKACQKLGHPYTGRFACTSFAKKVSTRQQIDRAILGAEKCFENFCQAHAHKTCPKQAAWWKRLFEISLCNDTLCTHRFVLKETHGVDLEKLGEIAIQQCKKIPAYKDHCI